jgi:hypothetical protein
MPRRIEEKEERSVNGGLGGYTSAFLQFE